MLCLNAEVAWTDPRKHRTVPIARFFQGFYEAELESGEIVAANPRSTQGRPARRRLHQVHVTARGRDTPLIGVEPPSSYAGACDRALRRDIRPSPRGRKPRADPRRERRETLRGKR